jgi:hypothetical protein
VKYWLGRIAFSLIASLLILFVGDYVSLQFRIPSNRQQFGQVLVQPLIAVPLKDKKTEYILGTPYNQTCTYSLFPQMGYSPCWYLSQHAKEQENI